MSDVSKSFAKSGISFSYDPAPLAAAEVFAAGAAASCAFGFWKKLTKREGAWRPVVTPRLVKAREKLLGENLTDACAYVSAEVHHCMTKALRLAGVPASGVRIVPMADSVRMDASALRDMVRDDKNAGRRPFLACGSAGMTRNPHNTEHTPGGSSSGSGAAAGIRPRPQD